MKQTLIMIHGFRGTHEGLHQISDALPKSYRCVIPDIPGFGNGDTLEHYSLEGYISWLHAFITAQNLKTPPVLLGHSFGSIITAAYAAKYPHTISKLILVNPIGAPALKGPQHFLTRIVIGYYWLGRVLPNKLARRWLSMKFMVFMMSIAMMTTKDKALRRWIHQQHYTHFSRFHSAQSVSDAFVTSISHSVRDVAADIATPTLLIVGDKDTITPLAAQKKLHARFKDSTLHVIDNVGHLTHYETPQEVAAATHDFIMSE
jgi:pimeloyl-ACP methyl ester carboxylesterase